MARFKVKTGRHVEADGTIYEAGTKNDIVTSDKPLDSLFINKFERIVREAPEPEPAPAPIEDIPVDETDEAAEFPFKPKHDKHKATARKKHGFD